MLKKKELKEEQIVIRATKTEKKKVEKKASINSFPSVSAFMLEAAEQYSFKRKKAK